jgi:phosphatidylserine decarboxylase
MEWFSQIKSPWRTQASIRVWRLFTDLDLSEAKQQRFESLQQCFTRELKPGSRPLDTSPAVLVSPSDGIVGACGRVVDGQLFQAKGLTYRIEDLFGPSQDTSAFRHGTWVTLRLTSSMYHCFHAPCDCAIEHVTYISGDTWNVNPIALARVERLFCRNERAVLRARLRPGGQPIAMVPVAAFLVASIRLHFLNVLLHLKWRGAHGMPCQTRVTKGEELGWFEHGSTILVFAPSGFELAKGIETGAPVRMGQALMTMPPALAQGNPS